MIPLQPVAIVRRRRTSVACEHGYDRRCRTFDCGMEISFAESMVFWVRIPFNAGIAVPSPRVMVKGGRHPFRLPPCSVQFGPSQARASASACSGESFRLPMHLHTAVKLQTWQAMKSWSLRPLPGQDMWSASTKVLQRSSIDISRVECRHSNTRSESRVLHAVLLTRLTRRFLVERRLSIRGCL